MKRRKRYKPRPFAGNRLLARLMAGAAIGEQPMSSNEREQHALVARLALDAILAGSEPTPSDWKALADTVETMRELARMGMLPDADAHAAIEQAVQALAYSAARAQQEHVAIRFPAQYIAGIKDFVEWYEAALEQLPVRAITYARLNVREQTRAALAGQMPHATLVRAPADRGR